jgi:hypothetical protein
MLESLMLIYREGGKEEDFDFPAAVQDWHRRRNRRIPLSTQPIRRDDEDDCDLDPIDLPGFDL